MLRHPWSRCSIGHARGTYCSLALDLKVVLPSQPRATVDRPACRSPVHQLCHQLGEQNVVGSWHLLLVALACSAWDRSQPCCGHVVVCGGLFQSDQHRDVRLNVQSSQRLGQRLVQQSAACCLFFLCACRACTHGRVSERSRPCVAPCMDGVTYA